MLVSRPQLTLYGLQGCHLCDDMREALELLRREFEFDVRELDVDCDPEIEARFGEHIPVLTDGENELCRHFFDAEAVRRHLEARRALPISARSARSCIAALKKETPG